ncbi:MAG: hypothetical protein K6E13_10395 [Lachnospiraceae bacterium]|nr:hypothetical protein [Lachnospiraceae bacterium]
MDQIVHDVRRDNWLSIVSACQERLEGMQVREWLAENGIKEKAYYYWQRKFRKELCAQLSEDTKDLPTVKSPEFVEIPIQKQVSEVSSAFTFNPDAVFLLILHQLLYLWMCVSWVSSDEHLLLLQGYDTKIIIRRQDVSRYEMIMIWYVA